MSAVRVFRLVRSDLGWDGQRQVSVNAVGIEFPDGTVALQAQHPGGGESLSFWHSIEEMREVVDDGEMFIQFSDVNWIEDVAEVRLDFAVLR